MSKKRKHKLEQKTALQQMRSRETARAFKALRSAETAEFRRQLVRLYSQEVENGHGKDRYRKTQNGKSVQAAVSRRNLPSNTELSKSNLSKEVRDVLQDGKQALACDRRRTRRELMFALQRAGVQGRHNKKAKWTVDSYLRCK